ncbi:MAG TPA: hypothetical protein VN046_09300 [Stenotrophobium sp.]|jgi:hypothetical protein|nr:hypothetical protein [Stenotrophobium sp.]
MYNVRLQVILTLLATLVLAACATPATRIKDHPDRYAALTPEQQTLVRQGQVALGMPAAAVELALGKPSSITERTDSKGEVQVWHYADPQSSLTAVSYSGLYDPFFFPFAPVVVSTTQPTRDLIRVYLNAGKVTAIEREMK